VDYRCSAIQFQLGLGRHLPQVTARIFRSRLSSFDHTLARLDVVLTKNNSGERTMSILGWLILGLISGYIASKIVNKAGEGIVLDIVLGIVGAFVGGWLFNTFGHTGVTGFNLYSMFVAVVGAIVVLVVYHALFRRRV
jgi:uncharacterized membrane protein YeaQ/YmgE (transglycosylase-associated protein family)